jgi:HK97 family phage portal protein
MSLFRPSETRGGGAVASGSPTYNPFENPSLPLAAVGLDNVFGQINNDAGQNVTVDTANCVPTVYRCMALLSTVIAGCPIKVYRGAEKEEVPNPLLAIYNPDMTYTQFELWELVVAHLCGHGNAFVFKKRDGFGRIIDLKPIYPGVVEVKLDRDSQHKMFLVKRLRPDGTIDPSKLPLVYTDYEVMHIAGFGTDGLVGLSPVQLASQTIGTALAADKLAAKFYSSGSQLGGIIKVKAPLRNQAQAEGIKARWMQKNAGVAHAGDVAILDAETDFQSVTIPPDQLQFLESRRWQTNEIARLYGVPPHLVGDVEKSTSWGTGIEVQNVGLVTYTASSYTKRIEQRVTREVVATRGQCAEFDLNDLMRGSTLERYQALAVAVGGPWMSRNEARVTENRVPLTTDPDYDELLPPQGIGPQDGDQQPQGNGKKNGKQNASGS